jgi:hypothetical protein
MARQTLNTTNTTSSTQQALHSHLPQAHPPKTFPTACTSVMVLQWVNTTKDTHTDTASTPSTPSTLQPSTPPLPAQALPLTGEEPLHWSPAAITAIHSSPPKQPLLLFTPHHPLLPFCALHPAPLPAHQSSVLEAHLTCQAS